MAVFASNGHTSPHPVAQSAVVTPSTSTRGIVAVSSSQGAALGAVVDHGTMVASSLPLAVGTKVQVEVANGRNVEATVVANDASLGLSVAALPDSLGTANSADAMVTLNAMTSQDAQVVQGTSLSTITVSHETLSQGTLSAATQDLGVIEAASATGSGVITGSSGLPEALLTPKLGSGIAVPLSMVTAHAKMAMTSASSAHGWLGIEALSVTNNGVTIQKVSGSNAKVLKSGDRIVKIDGLNVATTGDLLDYLYGKPAGSSVTLTLQRGGTAVQEVVTLQSQP